MKTINNIKTVKELKQGNCTVITKNGDDIKEFQGFYSTMWQCVFFTIPSAYEVIGYLQ